MGKRALGFGISEIWVVFLAWESLKLSSEHLESESLGVLEKSRHVHGGEKKIIKVEEDALFQSERAWGAQTPP